MGDESVCLLDCCLYIYVSDKRKSLFLTRAQIIAMYDLGNFGIGRFP